MPSPTLTSTHDVTIEIGAIPILVRTDGADFAQMLADRYGEFVTTDAPHAAMELEIRLVEAGYGIRDTGHGRDEEPGHGKEETTEHGIRTSDVGPRTSDIGPAASDHRPPTTDHRPPTTDHRLPSSDADLSVRRESGRWVMERGDFRAEWDPECRRGWVRQTANPYSIDGVLRILHSLILAREGGFLVHAASAVRNGRAFVFAGVSGTGKTTISRLAPPDVTLLTDEISYVRAEEQVSGARCQVSGGGGEELEDRSEESGARRKETGVRSQEAAVRGPKSEVRSPKPDSRAPCAERLTPDTWRLTPAFSAFGTPFAGELARIGQKVQAPLATLFLLQQGSENRIEPVSDGQAVRELMRHVLFFAQDAELVGMIFETVCEFVRRVPVRRLVFTKNASVWELIGGEKLEARS